MKALIRIVILHSAWTAYRSREERENLETAETSCSLPDFGRTGRSMTASRTIPFIVATIFIDAIGFGIIMPVLPQLVMEVGRIALAPAIEVGAWIGLVMALATFLASPSI